MNLLARWVAVGLLVVAGTACSGGGEPNSPSYLRSDDTALVPKWETEMPVYQGKFQSEQDIVQALQFDASTRELIEGYDNRVRYTSPAASLEIFFDEGFDRPFHSLRYKRTAPFKPPAAASGAALRQKWEHGADTIAGFVSALTKLTPVMLVRGDNDSEYADALANGYDIGLAINERLIGVDDMSAQVDEDGVFSFSTDELASDAVPSGTVQARTQAEIQAILSTAAVPTQIPTPPPIIYAFDFDDTLKILPYYLAERDEGGVFAIPMDRKASQ
ncbi:MAG: hypothetical protein ACOY0T_22820 [Myxococcota bacterium]